MIAKSGEFEVTLNNCDHVFMNQSSGIVMINVGDGQKIQSTYPPIELTLLN